MGLCVYTTIGSYWFYLVCVFTCIQLTYYPPVALARPLIEQNGNKTWPKAEHSVALLNQAVQSCVNLLILLQKVTDGFSVDV